MRVQVLAEGRVIFWLSRNDYDKVVKSLSKEERIKYYFANFYGEHITLDFPRGKFIAVLEDEAPQE